MPRARFRALIAGGVLLLLVGAGLPQALPAFAEDAPAGDGPATMSADAADAPRLLLAPQQPLLRVTDDTADFVVELRNPTAEALPAGELSLWLGADPLSDPAQLTAPPRTAPVVRTQLVTRPLPATPAGGAQTVTLTVPVDALPLQFASEPGVYPVRAEFDTADTAAAAVELAAQSIVVWRSAGVDARLDLSLVIPLVLPSTVQGMPTPADLAAVTPRLAALLDAAEQWDATLAIDPRIIAGIRVAGDATPPAARALLDRLEESVLPSFTLQFADADPAAQAALGYSQLLRPAGFSFVSDSASYTRSDNAETNVGLLRPTTARLLEWPAGFAGAWPAEGQVDADTLRLLHTSGMSSLILDSENVTFTDPDAAAARVELDSFETLVSDHDLAAAAREALMGDSATARDAARARLVGALALAAGDDGAHLLLALDRGAIADSSTLDALFTTLDALPWVMPTAAAAQPLGTARLEPGTASDGRLAALQKIRASADRIVTLAPLLSRPWYLTEYQQLRLLDAFATRYAMPWADFPSVASAIEVRDRELLTGVRVTASENTQLVGSSSRLPVLVHNALPFEAAFTLTAAATSAASRVPEHTFTDQHVDAGGNTTVLVQINSRVSSGNSALYVTIADVGGTKVYSDAIVPLTLRSSYETTLLVILGALAALLFGFGLWRSIRRHRAE